MARPSLVERVRWQARRVARLLARYKFVDGFHGDRMYQALVLELAGSCGITSFVETGTQTGHTTGFMAERFRRMPIYSVEVNPDLARQARERLRRFRNVTIIEGSSEAVLRDLIERGMLGQRPLFFLDAHWYDYWPIEDEARLIAARLREAVIVVDDFEVPGRSDFGFDVGGGGKELTGRQNDDPRACNYELLRPALGPKERYRLLYPAYTRRDAYGSDTSEAPLRGSVAVFQDLHDVFEAFVRRPLIQTHFAVATGQVRS